MEEDMYTETVSSLGFELYGTQANPCSATSTTLQKKN